jgi:beta-lactamase class A
VTLAATTHRRKVLVPCATLLIGLALGFLAHAALVRQTKTHLFVERREGGSRYTNPLLDCDIGSDVLSNQELRPFRRKLEAALASRVDKASGTRTSVYFRELNDGLWFSIGETERFVPASLRKLPLMLALLKEAEQGRQGNLLDREVVLALSQDYNANQNVTPSQAVVIGSRYTVRELIRRMIVYSDNNAFAALTRVVDAAELDKVYAKLSMLDPQATREDDFLTVETYASFFRVLYNASYVDKGLSEWALDVLARTEYAAGLVAGVPAGIVVAHKFGEKSDLGAGTVQLHDCGIVYYPEHPYLLCIMSQGRRFEPLDDVIREVSRLTFGEIDAQHSSRTAP